MLCTACPPPLVEAVQPLTCGFCITLFVSIILTVLLIASLLAWLAGAGLGDLGCLGEAGPDIANMGIPTCGWVFCTVCKQGACPSLGSTTSPNAAGSRARRALPTAAQRLNRCKLKGQPGTQHITCKCHQIAQVPPDSARACVVDQLCSPTNQLLQCWNVAAGARAHCDVIQLVTLQRPCLLAPPALTQQRRYAWLQCWLAYSCVLK